MDDHYRSKEVEESEVANSGDLISQMRERLRTQSQRIRSLESYKVLCEERLCEICPSHPLPVLPEHIGSGGSSVTQELLNSKQKIAKLEHQLNQSTELIPSPTNSITYNKLHELYTLLHQKYNSILKEKTELEESLRNEVISNEEQRAYIEVLKQAIEIRIESLGLKGFRAEEFAEFSSARISMDESRRETSKLATKVIDYEAQVKSMTESLKMKAGECRELLAERDELTEQLHQAAEALQYAEEEVLKLEEEKANLIDFAEAQTKAEQELKGEIKDLKTRIGTLQEEFKKTSKSLHTSSDENKKILNELESVKTEYNRNDKTLKETQQSYLNLKARAEEKDRSLQKYKEENNNLSIQNSSLQAENITLADSLNKLESQLNIYKNDLETSRNEQESLNENLIQLRANLQQNQEERYKLEKSFLETDHKYQNLQSDFKDVSEKHGGIIKNLQTANSEIENMKNALKISFDKEQALDHLVGELKKQIQTLQNELESLVKIQQTTNAELVESRDQHEQVKLRFISLEQENDALRKNNREINDLLDDERENTRKLTEEAEDLKYQIENLNKNIEDANENYKENEVQTKSLEKELENLTMLIAQTQNELAQEKYEKTTQYEDLCLVTTDLEKTKREFSNIKELYEMACRAARSMSSQLSPVNTGTFKDFTMTFAETLPSDFSLHKWVEKAVNELKDICDKYTETVQIIDSTKHKNNILKQDLDHLSQENSSFKSKELMLKSQIESLTKENAYVRETMKMQTGSLQQEILVLRNNVQSLNEENEELASKNRNANNEVIQVKSKVSAQEQSFQSMEKRLRLVVSEKEHLESLLSSYKSMDRSFGSYRNSS